MLSSVASCGGATTREKELATDERREIACEIFGGVGDVFQRAHPGHGANGPVEFLNLRPYAIDKYPGTLDRGWPGKGYPVLLEPT